MKIFAWTLAGALVAACQVSDADRCVDGWVWSQKHRLCVADTAQGSDSAAADASSDQEAGTGASDTGADIPDTDTDVPVGTDTAQADTRGLGTACDADADCADLVAAWCLKDPRSPQDPGVCTVAGCTAGDCGIAFRCCDCTALGVSLIAEDGPLCVPGEQVAALEGFGCDCE